ncbi:hypothetical protein TeGR_g7282 [Tetraparma gracilis]|uniref:Uncharacterized protein n=1 Tax=Tetraparma gracilis TaxID=2962635 RepID=A0ABQ6M5I4_9STRA|nr:hypothetical protein TeGR_g7282 [Tetraparma gracilis]
MVLRIQTKQKGTNSLSISGMGYASPVSSVPRSSSSSSILQPRPTQKKPKLPLSNTARRTSNSTIPRLPLKKKPDPSKKPPNPALATSESAPALPPLANPPKPSSASSKPSSKQGPKPKKKLGPLTRARNAWSDEHRMEAVRSQILIKYSHYTDKFEARDGVVRWADIDERYCLSAVFKGQFKRHVKWGDKWLAEEAREDRVAADFFLGFDPNQQKEYQLVVEEDPKFRTATSKAFKAPGGAGAGGEPALLLKPGGSGVQQQKLLTADLRKMSGADLRENSEEVKRMIEARDVEELLFSG